MRNRLSVVGLIFLCTLILVSAHGLRFYRTETMPLYDQYKFVLRSSSVSISFLDYPYEYLMGQTGEPIAVSRGIFLIAGIACTIIYAFVLRKIGVEHWNYSVFVLLLSPVFMYSFTIQNDYVIPLMFFGIGVLFILYQLQLASMIFLAISFILNQRFFLPILLLVSYALYRSKQRTMLLSLLIMAGATYIFTTMSYVNIEIGLQNLLKEFMSDFGAEPGIGIFEILLLFIGIIYAWQKKKEHFFPIYIMILLSIGSVFDRMLLIMLIPVTSFYGGFALSQLVKREWDSSILKSYVIILILCGLVFSSGASMRRISDEPPVMDELLSLEWLKGQDEGTVLSDYKYGYMIEAISSHNVYIDKDYYMQSKDKLKINNAYHIFGSRDYEEISQFMERNNISYIWINEEMVNGFPWTNSDEGMLLIVRNSMPFIQLYDHGGVEIWRYLPQG